MVANEAAYDGDAEPRRLEIPRIELHARSISPRRHVSHARARDAPLAATSPCPAARRRAPRKFQDDAFAYFFAVRHHPISSASPVSSPTDTTSKTTIRRGPSPARARTRARTHVHASIPAASAQSPRRLQSTVSPVAAGGGGAVTRVPGVKPRASASRPAVPAPATRRRRRESTADGRREWRDGRRPWTPCAPSRAEASGSPRASFRGRRVFR